MYNFVVKEGKIWNGISKTRNFGKVCSGYNNEEDFWNFQEPELLIGLKENMLFLDVGCGPGRIVRIVAPKVKKYYGIDTHEELIGIAKEKHKSFINVEFFVGNGKDLRIFRDKTFDYVWERLMFIHIPKETILEYLKEFVRVSKSGGIIVIPDLPWEKEYANGCSEQEILQVLNDKCSSVNIINKGNAFSIISIKGD